MSLIVKIYRKNFLIRYNFDEAIPYYEASNFKGLKEKEETFKNYRGKEIHYFIYSYSHIKHDKVVFFLPGIGPGHKAYMKEINEIASRGYKVITLDYEGCGYSKGDRLPSINAPTKDTINLINKLNIQEEIVLVGHSLGAYTALNVINKVNKIHKAIIMSGFIDTRKGIKKLVKSSFVARKIDKYENILNPDFSSNDNINYLSHTTDHILFIHSKDDSMVSYKDNFVRAEKLNNPHLTFISEEHKRHNPNYTENAAIYKDHVINNYLKLLNKGSFKSLEERKEYFKDIPLDKITEQDPKIINKIINFIG